MPSTKITELLKEHAEVYREFLPTLDQYQAMAKRALELQIRIYDLKMREAWPGATFLTAPLIASVSARETPAKVNGLLNKIAESKINVVKVIFDPSANAFNLYGE